MISYYSILVLGLELIVRYGRIWFLGIPICSGLGAYAAVLFVMKNNLPVIVGLPVSVFTGFMVGVIFALISNRISGDFFLIISLGMCEVVQQIIKEFEKVTGGAIGIMNIPPLSLGNYALFQPGSVLCVFLMVLLLIILLREILLRSIFRILILSSGEDQCLCRSLGFKPSKYLFMTFIIAGAISGIGGWLYAHYASYLDASILSLNESIMIFCMVIVASLNRIWGFAIGAAIFYSVPLMLQNIGLSDSVAFQVRPILFGLTLIFYMFYQLKSQKMTSNV